MLSNRFGASAVSLLSLFGFAGLILTLLLGFEEPNSTLLLVSTVLVFSTPAAVLVHLAATTELSAADKRIWIRELISPRAGSALSAYLISSDRSADADRFLLEATARRH
jgi:hypothetical protein